MQEYKVESDFMYEGYRCVVVFQYMGHRCGYVGVKKGRPLYGKEYSDYLDIKKSELDAEPIGKRGIMSIICSAFDEDDRVRMDCYFNTHGGLTYSGGNEKYPVKSNLWWLGFDCAHCDDSIDIDSLKKYFGEDCPRIQTLIGIEKDYPIVSGEVRTKEYVEDECKLLVNQIIELVK